MTTVDDFLDGVKLRIVLPGNQALFGDDKILLFANKLIRTDIVPMLTSMRQDYFVKSVDTPLIQGVTTYPLVPRAAGRTLRDIKIRLTAQDVFSLFKIEVEEEHIYRNQGQGVPRGYYLQGDKVVVLPPPGSSLYVVEQWIERRPSDLTLLGNTSQVLSIAGLLVTVDSIPTGLSVNSLVDLISQYEAYETWAEDIGITTINGTTLTLTSVPTGLVPGDRIALAHQTPFMPFPDEINGYLEGILARRMLITIGDDAGANALAVEIAADRKGIENLMQPRNRGETTKICNRRGLLKGRGRALNAFRWF